MHNVCIPLSFMPLSPPDSIAPSPNTPAADSGLQRVVLVATGRDHPGILDDMTHYVADRGGRMEGTRVSNLGGRVAILMLVAAEPRQVEAMASDLAIIGDRSGVRVTLEPADDALDERAACSFALHVSAATSEASEVLRQTSNLLKVLNINIADVDTHRRGDFDMQMAIDVPQDVPVGQLRELLGQLFTSNGATWDLVPAPGNRV